MSMRKLDKLYWVKISLVKEYVVLSLSSFVSGEVDKVDNMLFCYFFLKDRSK